jgi:hypothetical protein
MDYTIFDIETDELDAKKIHCLCATRYRKGVKTLLSLKTYQEFLLFFEEEEMHGGILVGHNIKRFDIPVLNRLLNTLIKVRLIDTLAISWYLFPFRPKHDLDGWGEYFGIEKPPIDDWKNLPIDTYIHRCSEDNKINDKLFNMQIAYLKAIYTNTDGTTDSHSINRVMDYLTWKLDCAYEQEEVKWRVDLEKCHANLKYLEEEAFKRFQALKEAIPDNILYRVAKKPKVVYKKDGNPSEHGKKWLEILVDLGLQPDYDKPIKVVSGSEQGNPGSHTQLKRWLDSLGWEPATFKFTKDPTTHAITKKVPQISNSDGTGVCESVKILFEKNPVLENLDGLFVLRHRIGLLKGFIRDADEQGFLKAEIAGLTNTLRFQHTTIVNLPKVSRAYGELIRGCLIAPDNDHVLCGSDMSSLEDTTKQHFMYYFDPEYVTRMRVPGFDPHLAMAVFAGMILESDSDFYKWYEKIIEENIVKIRDHKIDEVYVFSTDEVIRYKKIKKIRGDAKIVNFSAVYGVGAPKMALTTGWSISKCKALLAAYWKLNKAVKMVANACTVKTINGQMWLFNPISKFWYALRFEKDRFSTLNQGTGVYCFDMQVRNARKRGIKLCGQFHDEVIFPLLKGTEEKYRILLQEAIVETNAELKLNVPLGISIQFGSNYADIH